MSMCEDTRQSEIKVIRRLAAQGKDAEQIAAYLHRETECEYSAAWIRKLAREAGIELAKAVKA